MIKRNNIPSGRIEEMRVRLHAQGLWASFEEDRGLDPLPFAATAYR
jgi:hypothetical protein